MPISAFGASWRKQSAYKPDTAIELDTDEAVSGTATTYNEEKMRGLLDLVGSAESGVAGYNQVWGGRSRTPIVDMTVDEALAYQDTIKASGSPSTAIGKYQFLQKTLTGLKKELKLTGEEKMTPELQDKLAVHLMRRRGLDRYLGGEISKDQFVNRLAQEWAGLPTTAGSSYYAGDGLNKANVPLDAFMAAVTDLATDPELAGGEGNMDLGGGSGTDDLSGPPVLMKADPITGELTKRPVDVNNLGNLDLTDKIFLMGTRVYDSLGLSNTAERLFVDAIARGRTEPITEADLTDKDMSYFREIIEEKVRQTGKTSGRIGYGDYTGDNAPYNILGQFKFKVNDDGSIDIEDKYDFNRGGAWAQIKGFSTLEKFKEMLSDPENYGNYVGQKARSDKSANALPVKIKLPAKGASSE